MNKTKKAVSLVLVSSMLFFSFSSNVFATSSRKNSENFKFTNLSEELSPNIKEEFSNAEDKVSDLSKNINTYDNLPEEFDLRNVDGKNYVTPVKLQNPFGTCWAFGSVSALETSILYKTGQTFDEYRQNNGKPLDYSERHTAWFAASTLNDDTYYSSQNGEGVIYNGEQRMDAGGFGMYASSLWAQGTGPIKESFFPYHGANGLNDGLWYSKEDDWSVKDSDRFVQSEYEIQNFNMLPVPSAFLDDPDAFNQSIDIIKNEIMQGRSIATTFCADQSRGSDLGKEVGLYMDYDNYAHYTYVDQNPLTGEGMANHLVNIVGWDDDYPKENFLDKAPEVDEKGNAVKDEDGNIVYRSVERPPADGAFIVKNSWGSDKGSKYAVDYNDDLGNNFNYLNWGVKDEDDNSTGYFYISYYDKSFANMDNFDVDVDNNSDTDYDIMQYDFLPISSPSTLPKDDDATRYANVFDNVYEQNIKAFSTLTSKPNAKVEFSMYLLNDNSSSPEDGEKVCSFEEEYEFAGYHRHDLPKDEYIHIPSGSTYSVVVKQIDSETGNSIVPLNMSQEEMFIPDPMGGDSIEVDAVAKINEGESFMFDGESNMWSDWTTLAEELPTEQPGFIVDNPSIKVYAEILEKPEERQENKADNNAAVLVSAAPTSDNFVLYIISSIGLISALSAFFIKRFKKN